MGGTERTLANLAGHWEPERWQCHVTFMMDDDTVLVDQLERLGWAVHGPPSTGWIGWGVQLRRLVAEHRIDVVHAHAPLAGALARVALPRDVPFVYSEQSTWDHYRRGTYWLNRVTFKRNDKLVAVSEDVLRSIRRARWPRWDRGRDTSVIPNGIDLDALRGSAHAPRPRAAGGGLVVGSVAHLKPVKGHEHILRAAVEVRRAVPNVRFVFVGDGPARPAIEQLIDELDLSACVDVLGRRSDVAEILPEFDVVVLASLYEGLPMALLEAMAAGRALVATRVGGIPEVVKDGEDALIVPRADPQALSAAIIELLRDEPLRERLGAAASRRVEDFDAKAAALRLEGIYLDVLERPR